MTKRILITTAFSIFAFILSPAAIYAISITIDGEPVQFEGQPPVIVEGRALVPAYEVFGQLGFALEWSEELQQITLTSGDYTVILTIGSYIFMINGTSQTLEVPPQIINNNAMLPIRALAESVGFYVGWDSENNNISIANSENMPLHPFGQIDWLAFGDFDLDFLPFGKLEDYIPILAEQVRIYNELALYMWVGNPILHYTFIITDDDATRFWLIEPDGNFSEITELQAKQLSGLDEVPFSFDFSEFADNSLTIFIRTNTQFAIDRADRHHRRIANGGGWELFSIGTHEAFHIFIQNEWAEVPTLNFFRDEFLEDFEARVARHMIQLQMLEALEDMQNEELVLNMLASYVYWRDNFPEEHRLSIETDRYESGAYYFDVLTSLSALFASQLQTREDVNSAVSQIARFALHQINENNSLSTWLGLGLVEEAYYLGLIGFLLDIHMDSADWQARLAQNANATQLSILLEHFSDREIPAPRIATQQERDRLQTYVNEKIAFIEELERLYPIDEESLL